MKIKPIISEHIYTQHTSFVVDFHLDMNITLIAGDAGEGKSFVYRMLKELSAENKEIRCFNYLDIKSNYKNSIKLSKRKLFIIDNADILLDDKMRNYIALDSNNQYIIIGRNPTGLQLTADEIYELKSEKKDEKTLFTLKRSFHENKNDRLS